MRGEVVSIVERLAALPGLQVKIPKPTIWRLKSGQTPKTNNLEVEIRSNVVIDLFTLQLKDVKEDCFQTIRMPSCQPIA